jgi:non-heme chloroperoxidase
MDSSKKSSKLIRGAQEIYYPGRAHGITATEPDRVNSDSLEFLKKDRKAFKAAGLAAGRPETAAIAFVK